MTRETHYATCGHPIVTDVLDPCPTCARLINAEVGGCARFREDVTDVLCQCGRLRNAHAAYRFVKGSTVKVGSQEMTVIRYVERDNVYLLETRDGFNTRNFYHTEEVTQ